VLESDDEERADAAPAEVMVIEAPGEVTAVEFAMVLTATVSALQLPVVAAFQHTIALVPLKVVTVIAVGVPPVTKSTDTPVRRAVDAVVYVTALQVPLVLAASA
jgi:hypothetical protein